MIYWRTVFELMSSQSINAVPCIPLRINTITFRNHYCGHISPDILRYILFVLNMCQHLTIVLLCLDYYLPAWSNIFLSRGSDWLDEVCDGLKQWLPSWLNCITFSTSEAQLQGCLSLLFHWALDISACYLIIN